LQVAEVRADDAAIPLVRLGLAHAALRAAHAAG
jgi:hypothetical protein